MQNPDGYTAQLNTNLRIELDSLQGNYLMDARASKRFANEAGEKVGGHIPNTVTMPFSALIKEGRIIDKDLFERITEGALEETTARETVGFTCGTGVTACITALAWHEHARYEPRI